MTNSWRHIRRFERGENWLLVQALFLLPLLSLALRYPGFQRTQTLLARWLPAPVAEVGTDRRAQRAARIVAAAAKRGLHTPRCLARSMTLWWLLRRRKIDCALRIGVRKQDGALEAHAWVEYAGTVLGEPAEHTHQFVPFTGTVHTKEIGLQ